jgi:hypothetical protein
MRRKSWDNVRRANSAIATPVGPAPTTVKVKAVRRSSSELESQQGEVAVVNEVACLEHVSYLSSTDHVRAQGS